jgi:hypothetical protein
MLVKFGLRQPPRNHTCEILDGTSEAIRTEKIGGGFFLRLRLFHRKTICVKCFLNFPVFGSIRKLGQRKTIFSQRKT